jgi:hypothetical protein
MPRLNVRVAALVPLMALALPLAGCETTSDPLATVVTAPGQYELYDCPAIKVTATGIVGRQRQLEDLMARANQGPVGGLISATTYKPEYVTLRGKLSQLRRVAAEKNCKFVPGQPVAGR